MPLLECPDCTGKVSDSAPACPHCGKPKDRLLFTSSTEPTEKAVDDDAGLHASTQHRLEGERQSWLTGIEGDKTPSNEETYKRTGAETEQIRRKREKASEEATTNLADAIRRGDIGAVDTLLARNPSISDVREQVGMTLVAWAEQHGRKRLARLAEAHKAQLQAKLEVTKALKAKLEKAERNAEPKAKPEGTEPLEATPGAELESNLKKTECDPERRKAALEYLKVAEHLTTDELELTRDRLADLFTSTGGLPYKFRGCLVQHTLTQRASGASQGNAPGRLFLSKVNGLFTKAAYAYRIDSYPETKDIRPGQLIVNDQVARSPQDLEDCGAVFPMWSNEGQGSLLSGVDSTSQEILDALSPQRMEEIWSDLKALRTKLLEGGEQEQWITYATYFPLRANLGDADVEDEELEWELLELLSFQKTKPNPS